MLIKRPVEFYIHLSKQDNPMTLCVYNGSGFTSRVPQLSRDAPHIRDLHLHLTNAKIQLYT